MTLNSIDSTNTFAKQQLKENPSLLDDGFVVCADTQTKGRGTHGRDWYSSSDGGLYYTLAIGPPTFDFEAIEYYHRVIAEAIQQVLLAQTNVDVSIRYPNDLYINSKKVGGVLMESSVKGSEPMILEYLIIGIGLNINQASFPVELENSATSLFLETGQTYQKHELIKPLTRALKAIFMNT